MTKKKILVYVRAENWPDYRVIKSVKYLEKVGARVKLMVGRSFRDKREAQ